MYGSLFSSYIFQEQQFFCSYEYLGGNTWIYAIILLKNVSSTVILLMISLSIAE